MFQRMLVTLDGSKLAEGVLPYAAALAKIFDAWITLLSVVPHEETAEGGEKRRKYLQEVEERSGATIREYLHRVESRLKNEGVNVDIAIQTGNVPRTIVKYAEDGHCDLVAIATRGRSGIARWMMGSVADHVLQSTSTPLLLIKPEDQDKEWSTAAIASLLVPLDGSPLAESVIPFIEELALKSSVEVVLIQTLPTMSQLYLGIEPQAFPTDVMQAVEESATTYLTGLVERLKAKGIRARWESPMGDPGAAVVDFAKKLEDSIVVMSTRGRTGFSRWILGSVADKVVRGAAGPVLLMRPRQETGS